MKKRNILISLMVIVAIAWTGIALVPPPPVNQNIGRYDTSVNQLKEQDCRTTNCHDSGVPDRHHNLLSSGAINPATGQPFSCTDCHPVVSGPNGQSILLDRNCLDCHNGSAFYANPTVINITRPHHNTTFAQIRDCKFCHGAFVDNYNDGHYIPAYPKSEVTPSTHNKTQNLTSGRYWGGCYACHEANFGYTPQILDSNNTHHNTILGVTGGQLNTPNTCAWCHNYTINDGVLDIRRCEECHSVATIHNTQYNYTATNGQLGYGHIGNNWDCNGCHAWYVAGAALFGAIIPDTASITPNKLTEGVQTVITIAGSDFISGGQYNSVVELDGNRITPDSVTDSEIKVTIPALAQGVHNIRVIKTGDALGDKPSKLSVLTVVPPVDIVNAKVKKGTITITGKGFGTQPDPLYVKEGYLGVFVQRGTSTPVKATITSWTDTRIVAKLDTAKPNDEVIVKALNGQDTAKLTSQNQGG